jgi:hypothetical protein
MTGDPAPGTSGAYYQAFPRYSDFDFNNAGQVAFMAVIAGNGVTDSNDRGIWRGISGDDLELVVRAGAQAPALPFHFTFSDFSQVAIGDGGDVVFLAGASVGTGIPTFGIWKCIEGSEIQIVAAEGQHAPGTAAGVTFDAFYDFDFAGLSINSRGRVAFGSFLTGAVNAADNYGIWAQDRNGQLRLIAREGDLIDVDDGPNEDYRTISSLNFRADSNSSGMQGGGFNNAGQFALLATFTDGTSGILVSDTAAVPEPMPPLTAAMALLAMSQMRGRGKS